MMNPSRSRFARDARGNITVLYALTLPILIFAVGVAVDFSRASSVRTRLNAAADAAALAALTPAMLQAPASVAQAAAANMFDAEIADLTALVPGDTSVTVSISNPPNEPLQRVVTVNYSARSSNIFAGVLGVPALGVAGSSSAQASAPPNIDFYLLLDNSPSMSLPATSAGIIQMQALTSAQYNGAGCAFACHQASTNNGDTEGNPCWDGTRPTGSGGLYCEGTHAPQIDNFALAKNNNITLRLDELRGAVSTLMTLANSTATSGQFATAPSYRFAAYSIDTLWNAPTANNTLMGLTGDYVSRWSTDSANFNVMEMFSNSVGCANASCSSGAAFDDVATNYDNALSSINATMPDPGNGTNQPGDKPQEVLFFVTDGVEDEDDPSRIIQQINAGTSHNYCTDIKNRGVKIAILYTEYLPVPVNGFYDQHVEPIQPDLGPALQACASPGLFYDAAIGADLGQALSSLFRAAVQSATLTH